MQHDPVPARVPRTLRRRFAGCLTVGLALVAIWPDAARSAAGRLWSTLEPAEAMGVAATETADGPASRYGLVALNGGKVNMLGRALQGHHTYGSILGPVTPASLGVTGAWQGTDLRLLNVRWSGHRTLVGLAFQDDGGQALLPVDPTGAMPGLLPGSGYRVGLYALDEWQLSPTWTATLGLRVDHRTVASTQIRPRAGLIWRVAPDTLIKAQYGRIQSALAAERRAHDGSTAIAEPLLTGERIDALEVEADQRLGTLTLRAAAYSWTLHDMTVQGFDPLTGLVQFRAGETVAAQGLELSAEQVWAAAGARLRGSASVQDAATADGMTVPNTPQLQGKLLLAAALPWAGLRLGYEWLYDAGRVGPDGTEPGAFALSNLSLGSAELAEGLDLTLSVLNLFNRRYAPSPADLNAPHGVEQDGRGVRLGLAYRF